VALFASSVLAFLAVPQGQTQQCEGNVCEPDLIAFPPPAWSVSYNLTHGQGKDQEFPCDKCKKCRGKVFWSHLTEDMYVVSWGNDEATGGDTGGTGQAMGNFTLFADCDQDVPELASFSDTGGNNFLLYFYCTCEV